MKKVILAILLVTSVCLLTVTSCKKSKNSISQSEIKKTRDLDYYSFESCNLTNQEVTAYENRCDEEKIYSARFALAYAIKDDIRNTVVSHFIFSHCQEDGNNECKK